MQSKKARPKTLYIFIDESGNFDFSEKGTSHFVLTAISTFLPLQRRSQLARVRYGLLARNHDQEFFHATEDKQTVRDAVFAQLATFSDIEVAAAVVRKKEIGVVLPNDDSLYEETLQCVLFRVFHRYDMMCIRDVVVVIGALFTGRKRELILKKLKMQLKYVITKPYRIYFHRVIADVNCQIADYCGWAIYVAFERNEKRPLDAIKHLIRNRLQVF